MDKEKVIDILTGRNMKPILLFNVISAWSEDIGVLKRRTLRIHRILSAVAWGLFIVSLIKMAVIFHTLPDKMGIHFIGLAYIEKGMNNREVLDFILHGYQHYDVVGTKWYIAYPYGITFLALAASEFAIRLSKMKSKMNENDALMLRSGLTLALDAERFVCTVYFCVVWTELMIRQLEMRALFTLVYAFLAIGIFFDLILFAVQMRKKSK
ncbi:MAG: hypothetical protein J6M17_12775 [Ruminococcus sp.]|nr:hypothetical protein [Ruminococcus sp.]